MDKDLVIPNVEIIENGKQISQERIDPNIASFIMQAAATAQLVKIRKLEESKIPSGYSSYTLELTSNVTDFRIANPWISFDIINDGPGLVKFSIEKLEGGLSGEADVRVNQVINVDYHYPIIYRLYLSTKVYRTRATVRIYAIEGNR